MPPRLNNFDPNIALHTSTTTLKLFIKLEVVPNRPILPVVIFLYNFEYIKKKTIILSVNYFAKT